MSLNKLLSGVSRLFFWGALALLMIVIAEGFANLFGHTVLRGVFRAGRMLEFAAVLLIFVITLTLQQVRDALKK